MKKSLKARLILTYTAVALLTILTVVLVVQLTSDRSFKNMLIDQQVSSLSEAVISYYQQNDSLQGFSAYYILLMHRRPPSAQLEQFPPGSPRVDDLRGLSALVDNEGRAILPLGGYRVGEPVSASLTRNAREVNSDGTVLAWIVLDDDDAFKFNPVEEAYMQRTRLAVGIGAGVGLSLALICAIVLAEKILKPIRRLTLASAQVAQGELGLQVPVSSVDEIGQLSLGFNRMSKDLAHADSERKRLTADITHDLSTPLQIISGYIEMFESGDLSLNPERLNIIKTEIETLHRMLGDLSTLSLLEADGLNIQMLPTDPVDLLEQLYQAYLPIAEHQGVSLHLQAESACPAIMVDEGRILQVLKNLMENALRYTPAGGKIVLSCFGDGDAVCLCLRDSGAGIVQEDLPFVFDRFYQADASRGGGRGKMGLGLAICKALCQAHGAKIWAESAGLGQGTAMFIRFLCANREARDGDPLVRLLTSSQESRSSYGQQIRFGKTWLPL